MTEINPAFELCEMVGETMMTRICERFGGQQIYIPHAMPKRAVKIRADFNRVIPGAGSVGVAYETVAQDNGVSPRTVQRMVCGR